MDRDEIKEKLSLYRTLVTIFWTSMFVMGGGAVKLSYDLNSFLNWFYLGVCIILEVALLIAVAVLIRNCKRLLKRFRETK